MAQNGGRDRHPTHVGSGLRIGWVVEEGMDILPIMLAVALVCGGYCD